MVIQYDELLKKASTASKTSTTGGVPLKTTTTVAAPTLASPTYKPATTTANAPAFGPGSLADMFNKGTLPQLPATGSTGYVQKVSQPTTSSTTTTAYPTYSPDMSALYAQLAELMAAYDAQRAALEAQYGTNASSADQAYQTMLDNLARQRRQNTEQFQSARGTISENAYDRSRQMATSLAARMLSGSGLQQLGDVQNRMQTGREMSSAAQQYYNTGENLAATEKESLNNYNTAKQQLSNSLASALASLMTQKAGTNLSFLQQGEAMKQAAAQSAANAAQFTAQQEAALKQYQNTSSYDIASVVAEDPLSANQVYRGYTTRVGAVKGILANAGQATESAASTVEQQARANYQAYLNIGDKTTAAKIKQEYIKQGYPSILFPEPSSSAPAYTASNYTSPTTVSGPGSWY